MKSVMFLVVQRHCACPNGTDHDFHINRSFEDKEEEEKKNNLNRVYTVYGCVWLL